MSKFKGIGYPIIVSLILLFLAAGSSLAVLLAGIDDEVDFGLGNSIIFIEGTAGGNNELAEVLFTIDFHDDAVPNGNISKLIVKFEYNPAFLTFVEARPAPGWGTLTEDVDYYCVHNEVSGIIQFTIYPEIAPTFPVESGVMTLAYFDFKAKCQAQENPTELLFSTFDGSTSESSLDVELSGGGRNSYTPLMTFTADGSVSTEFYWVRTSGTSAQLRGAIGTQITVPFNFHSNCLIDGITFQMEYDRSALRFLGVEDWSAHFPAGFTPGTTPQPNDFPIYISLNTGANYDIPPSVESDFEIFKLRFEVIGDWDGEYTIVKWSPDYNDPDREFRVGNGTDGYCVEVTNSLENNPASQWFLASWQYLEEYHAKLESYLADGNFIWNTADYEQDLEINVRLCNNFEAGTHVAAYRPIAAIVDPPDILSFGYGDFERIPGLGVYFDVDYSSASHDTLTFYQTYKSSGYTNVLDLSGCDAEGSIDILNLPFEFNDATVTGFTNEEHALDFASTVSTQPSTCTHVKASHSSKVMLPPEGLDTAAIPFKIATGEFSCLAKSSTSWVVDQEYYIRNSFDLASFSVKVAVSGYHYINSVTPEPGVSYTIALDKRSATFASNEDWNPAVHPTIFRFAQIHFNNIAPPAAARVDPGTDCYWRTYTSTIAFLNPFMSDLLNDNPLDPEGNLPFLFTSAKNISRSELICFEPRGDESSDWKMTADAIPTEFNLHQNYPNPFNPDTRIALDLPAASHVRIEIFNILGQHVKTLVNETREAGSYEITWNATDDNGSKVSSGIYLCSMQTDSYNHTIRMLFMK